MPDSIYIPAHQRMARHLKINNQHLNWDFTNNEELRVSKNIFDYLIQHWEYCNKLLESGKFYIETVPEGYKVIVFT